MDEKDKTVEESFDRMLKRPLVWCVMCADWVYGDRDMPCRHPTGSLRLGNRTTMREFIFGENH